MPKKYPLEFKKQAIRRYKKGESIPALCQELHISQSTFYHWRNQYRSIQTSAHTYTPAEFDVLVRRLQKAEHKLSIIQLSGYLSKVPLQDKLATLEHFHNEMSDLYSVHELCEALNVSRGTFYNHIFRRADRSKYESEKAQLMLKVKQIFDDSEQRYGADKIHTVLAENGLRISTKRVLSIMQELGLHSIRADAKKVYKNQMRKKQNLLHRKFTTDHPNQVWVSDITYFKIKNAWVYLCAIIDLFSRKVVGYRVSHAASTRLVTATFRNAYVKCHRVVYNVLILQKEMRSCPKNIQMNSKSKQFGAMRRVNPFNPYVKNCTYLRVRYIIGGGNTVPSKPQRTLTRRKNSIPSQGVFKKRNTSLRSFSYRDIFPKSHCRIG